MIPKNPQEWGDAGFEDVREQERRARQDHADFVTKMRQAIAMCDGIIQLETSGGFKHVQSTLADMLQHRTTELLSAREDRSAAVLQGRCQELKAILSLMANTRGNREALANALKAGEDRFRELERGFKPQPSPEKTT
jgi:hypothetical protein